MVSEPQKWIKDFKDAGAEMFTFHVEAEGTIEDHVVGCILWFFGVYFLLF